MKSKRFLRLIGILLSTFLLSGCRQLLNADVGTPVLAQETKGYVESIYYEITDLDRRTEYSDKIEINMNNLTADKIDMENYTYDEGYLTIHKGGDYILSGKKDNCNLVIKAYDDEVVHLIFNDVELHAETGPVLYGEQAGKIIITLAEDTENYIYDSAEYASDAEACIFSNCDLTINGGGSLSAYGYYHDAVRSKDRLKVIGANLYIRAKNNGIRGNDGVVIEESNIEVECEGTGILANDEQACIAVQGGRLKVTAGENAIYADSSVSVKNCLSDLYSVQEAIRCGGKIDVDEESTK
ncbi:carbohydrate-binding domain-containing protein [Lachnospiraceae bacterium]|nr:carbohydrate-binding domain-containing protein [Lachnospiraceae bacterium]GFI70321.1 carbohydrate-binding domain-containing protein [Lachnospiraceae bacterium]